MPTPPSRKRQLNDLREVVHCESVRDFVSRDLLVSILQSEAAHIDYIERQFDLIKALGIESYTLLNAAAAPDQD